MINRCSIEAIIIIKYCMSQEHLNKYSVAWFKLAEFVSKREKEKALALHKLLAYSLQDTALSLQLKGDILTAFSDESAIEYYIKAADYYEKFGEVEQSIYLYQNIFNNIVANSDIAKKILDLYIVLGDKTKAANVVSSKLLEKLKDLDVKEFLARIKATDELIYEMVLINLKK